MGFAIDREQGRVGTQYPRSGSDRHAIIVESFQIQQTPVTPIVLRLGQELEQFGVDDINSGVAGNLEIQLVAGRRARSDIDPESAKALLEKDSGLGFGQAFLRFGLRMGAKFVGGEVEGRDEAIQSTQETFDARGLSPKNVWRGHQSPK